MTRNPPSPAGADRSRLARTMALSLAAGLLSGCSSTSSPASSKPLPPISSLHEGPYRQISVAAPIADPAFLEQFAATYRFGAGTPRSFALTPDGRSVLFLRSGPRSVVQDLYEFDVASGSERVLLTADQILKGAAENLSPEEKARRERMRVSSRGITSYSLSKDGKTILVPLSGKLYLVDRAEAKVREVGEAVGFPIDPRLSDDGTKIGCVRDGDLHVIDVATGHELKLTVHTSESVEYGTAEFVAAEEMDRREGYWFSPDSSKVVYTAVDTTGLERFTIADPVNPDRPPNTWAYPRPGKANARVGLLMAQTGMLGYATAVNWDHEKYPYLVSVKWEKNAPLTLVVSNRAQTEMVVYAVGETGSLTELLTERDDAWVEIRQTVPHWLEDGSGFLWISESSGWPELQLRDAAGKLVSVVAGEAIGFRGLIDVDEKGGFVYVSAGKDPTESHVWRAPLRARIAPQALTAQPGQHGMLFSKDHRTSLHTGVTADGRRFWNVRTLDPASPERAEAPIKSVAEAPPFIPKPEWTTVKAGGREFHAYILRPRNFDLSRKYPVIDSVYAGPTANVVAKNPFGQLLNQWIADHGFIVVGLDNRGTELRGREWARAWKTQSGNSKGDLIDVALQDHADVLKALAAKYPELDRTRVGVYGWSFGGYFSAMAAMRRPDVYAAGCAGAPVCDFADYDTTYTERYLGTPQENPEGYKNSSVLTWCKDLKVPLMVVHGTADDNVYFMHSLKMTDALFRAGKPYEFLVLPGFTHMVPDPVVTRSLYTRVADFFVRELRSH